MIEIAALAMSIFGLVVSLFVMHTAPSDKQHDKLTGSVSRLEGRCEAADLRAYHETLPWRIDVDDVDGTFRYRLVNHGVSITGDWRSTLAEAKADLKVEVERRRNNWITGLEGVVKL